MPKLNRPYRYGKSVDAWLDDVYEANKTLINDRVEPTESKSSREVFKDTVFSYIEEDGLKPFQALKTVSNSDFLSSRAERGRENLISAMKKDKNVFNDFRKKIGWSEKIDLNKFEWDKANKQYVYRGKTNSASVIVDPSPKNGANIQIKVINE